MLIAAPVLTTEQFEIYFSVSCGAGQEFARRRHTISRWTPLKPRPRPIPPQKPIRNIIRIPRNPILRLIQTLAHIPRIVRPRRRIRISRPGVLDPAQALQVLRVARSAFARGAAGGGALHAFADHLQDAGLGGGGVEGVRVVACLHDAAVEDFAGVGAGDGGFACGLDGVQLHMTG